jgi:protein involved in polysaccharide export with SLBB domain
MQKAKLYFRSLCQGLVASILPALLLVAGCLPFAGLTRAQAVPDSTLPPGEQIGGARLTDQQGNVDCSDPQMATSQLCNSRPGGTSQGGVSMPATSQGGTGYLPGQPSSIVTYSDVGPPSSVSGKQTRFHLPPEHLTEFQKFTAMTTQEILPVFGADLFANVPSTFAPLNQTPVPPDYVIGPEDEIRLRVWGQVGFNANLRVSREGDIFIPQVGSVHVAGLPFSQLQQHLHSAIARVYRNFDLSVDLGQIRAIQVYVTGQARRPGVYTVSSLSTMVDAIFASGGPSIEGSLRRIELRRAGEKITQLDLYDLLIRGDNSKDVKLLSGDVIFIPPAGPAAAILGSVRKPAIYELLDNETVSDLIHDAGGLTAIASEARVSLERIVNHRARQAMEIALDSAGKSTAIENGDILRVLPMVPQYEQTVMLRGNVANPGRFAWYEGMRLSDLIPDQQSLITREYWWRRTQLGLPPLEYQPLAALSTVLQPANPIDLQNRAQPANPSASPNSVAGSTSSNASAASSESMAPTAVGLQNPTVAQDAQRRQSASPQQRTASENPSNAGTTLASANTEQEYQEAPPLEVRRSAPEIDWDYAVIERMDPTTLRTSLIPFDLGRLVKEHDSSQDLELRPGDVITVFSQNDIHVPLRQQASFVRLEGEFNHAGTYSVSPGETLRSLVARAGGLTSSAYLYGSEFTRLSTQAMQQRRLDESIQELTLQMQRGNLALASSPISTPQDLAGVAAAEASERELIAQLKLIRATGRIVFEFHPGTSGISSLPDISLEDGDSFTVPSKPPTVNVVGAVPNQNSFLYRPAGRTEFYLRMAGGPNAYADRKRMFVIRANGAVISRTNVHGGWGDEFDRVQMNPGDTLVVPEKGVRPSALRNILDISTFASQFAFDAAAIDVLR